MALPQPVLPRFTYADYCRWPEGERWELIDGEAYAMAPAPTIDHQIFLLSLARQIDEILDGTPCRTFLAPVDVLLPKAGQDDQPADSVVQPDILVVCDPAKITPAHVRGAPDWIIEILSPSTARYDHIVKRQLYEDAGVREYWLVHPVDRILTIYTLQEGKYAGPQIVELAGETAPAILPNVLIRWQRILDRLPEKPAPLPSPPRP